MHGATIKKETKLSFTLRYPTARTQIFTPSAFALSVASSAERFVSCPDPLLRQQISDNCLCPDGQAN
jgi:hypothetical protein